MRRDNCSSYTILILVEMLLDTMCEALQKNILPRGRAAVRQYSLVSNTHNWYSFCTAAGSLQKVWQASLADFKCDLTISVRWSGELSALQPEKTQLNG